MKRHAPRLAITRARMRSSLSARTYTRSSTARGATRREKYDTTELAATQPRDGKETGKRDAIRFLRTTSAGENSLARHGKNGGDPRVHERSR